MKYPLPTNLEPEETSCMRVYYPNDPGFRQALLGAISSLQNWYVWQRDDAESGKRAAARYRLAFTQTVNSILAGEGCTGGGSVGVIDARVSDCGLEVKYSTDPDTWVNVGDLDDCISGRLGGFVAVSGDQVYFDANGDGLPDLTINLNINNTYPPIADKFDWDNVWSGLIGMMADVDEHMNDMLDQIDLAVTAYDAVSRIEALDIPSEAAGAGVLLDIVIGILSIGTAAARALMTLEAREEIACEMFCDMYNSHDLNFTTERLQAWMDEQNTYWLTAGDIYKACMVTVGKRWVMGRYDLHSREKSDGWTVLCDCTGIEWTVYVDFRLHPPSYYGIGMAHGVWVDGVGIQGVNYYVGIPSNKYHGIQISDRYNNPAFEGTGFKVIHANGIPKTPASGNPLSGTFKVSRGNTTGTTVGIIQVPDFTRWMADGFLQETGDTGPNQAPWSEFLTFTRTFTGYTSDQEVLQWLRFSGYGPQPYEGL